MYADYYDFKRDWLRGDGHRTYCRYVDLPVEELIMGIKQALESLNRLAGPLIKVTAFIAGVSLFSMMLLVALDVILRFFKRPVPGTYEIVEYLMALTVSFGIVACAHRGEHIKVDIVTNTLTGSVRNALASLVALITLMYTLPIMWENLLYIQDLYSSRVTSAVLLIPVYPFSAAVAAAFVILCMVFLIDVIGLLEKIKALWTL